MTCLWDAEGNRVPVTVLHVSTNHINVSSCTKAGLGLEPSPPRLSRTSIVLSLAAQLTASSSPQLDDVQVLSSNSYPATSTTPAHHSVIVGCSPRKVKTTGAALLGQFQKAGVDPKMRVVEFQVTEDAVVPPGQFAWRVAEPSDASRS